MAAAARQEEEDNVDSCLEASRKRLRPCDPESENSSPSADSDSEHSRPEWTQPELTFMFNGKLAGAPCTVHAGLRQHR